ncbi:MAG: DUF167 domain-containing protein [Proteobacteria bacterium]|nr:DUF167 domain-containing protein [Pseudomonadota bacterium]
MNPRPWSALAGGVALDVRLTPKGGRDAIDGVDTLGDGRSVLKVRVRAVPQDGEANEALCRLIAKTLNVAPRDVTLAAGATSRIKRLTIAGDTAALIAVLEKRGASR